MCYDINIYEIITKGKRSFSNRKRFRYGQTVNFRTSLEGIVAYCGNREIESIVGYRFWNY